MLASALLVLPVGYLFAVLLSGLFSGEEAMILLFAVFWAAAFLLVAALAAAVAQVVRVVRGARN
jgi:hypothetical protein